MPSLLGLVLVSFAFGALAALATRRRGSAFLAMTAALVGGIAAPWASAALALPIAPLLALSIGAATCAFAAAGLAALIPRRH